MEQGLKAISAMATRLAIESNEVCKKANLDDAQTAIMTEHVVSRTMNVVINSAFSDTSAAEFTKRLKTIGDRHEALESSSGRCITLNKTEKIERTYKITKKE